MEWKEVSIQDLIDKIIDYRGKTPKKTQSGVKLITAKVIKNGQILKKANFEYIAEQDYDNVMRRGIPILHDILITTEAPLGEVAIIRSNEKIALAQRVILLRINKKIASPYFLYHSLRSKPIQTRIYARGTGTTVLGIKNAELRKVKIPLPPLPTQQKIASILSAYDDLIENNQQRIAILEQMAQNIYQEWFVRFRFPGHAQSEFVEGLPKGWKKVSIGDAFEIVGGGTPSKENEKLWIDGNINWFTPSDITRSSNIFLESSSAKINNLGLANSSAKLFPPYSVMMTSRATIGKIGINTKTASTNQGFIICLPNNNFSYVYIYHWLKQNNKYIDLISSGATFKEIPKSLFKQLKIIKPGTEIMNNYTKISSAIFSLIENIYHKNNLLQQQRDKLLPRLLSGKLEV